MLSTEEDDGDRQRGTLTTIDSCSVEAVEEEEQEQEEEEEESRGCCLRLARQRPTAAFFAGGEPPCSCRRPDCPSFH